MADFIIKRGDTFPPFKAFLYMADRTPVPVTNGVFRFRMQTPDGVVVVNAIGVGSIVGKKTLFEYSWQPGDTDQVGQFLAEIKITYVDSADVLTVPNGSYIRVQVIQDLSM